MIQVQPLRPIVLAIALVAVAAAPRSEAAYAEALFGSPPVARFAPDIPFYPQNFAIAQDASGLVYLGNSDGVLLFDGARWSLLELPNHDLVRSLQWDGAARVYVGGYDALGWLETTATGQVAFHDLTARARELNGGAGFADVWELFVFPEGVLFRAVNHVFLYEPASDRLRMWSHDGRFGTAWRDADGIVLQFRGQGFKRLVGEAWTLVPGGDAFKDLVYEAFPLPDGGRLIAERGQPWRALRDGKAVFATLPPALPPIARMARGDTLADGTLALSGDDGMLHLWDPRGAIVHRVRIADERLDGLIEAHDGGLLIVGDTAFHRLQWPARWTAVGAEIGLRGSTHAAVSWRGARYALTGSGAQRLERDAAGEISIRRMPWTDDEAWSLLPIDDRSALLAESYALLAIEGDRVRPLSDKTLYPRVLVRSRVDPDLVYVGTEHGLALVRREAGAWTLVVKREEPDSPNVTHIVERADGELWLGTERGGVVLARLDAARRSIASFERFAETEGLRFGRTRESAVALMPDGRLIASTPGGLFRLEGRRFARDPLDGLDALRPAEAMVDLTVAPDGTVWAWTRYAMWRRDAKQPWRRETASTRGGVFARVLFDGDGRPLVIATNGVLLSFDAEPRPAAPAPGVVLRGVSLVEGGAAPRDLELEPAAPIRIAQGDNLLRARFALPELREPGAARYRGRLQPLEPEFSEWGASAQYGYFDLRPGRYRLEIEARAADGTVSAALPFEFEIAPPWHATPWARLLWSLLTLAALAAATRFVIRRRTALLAEQTARLERMVDARTRELADANRKLDTIAHLDGLTGLPNRRRLDEYLGQVWAHCAERERPLAVLAIDVDRFKDYNDKHGHLAGDTLLKRLAPLLTRNLRRTEDLAARYGGEEFLVVLPGADAAIAHQVAEALREKVATSSIGATVSIGVAAETPREGRAVTELVALADAALYKAKAAGRNRVEVDGA